MVGRKQLNWDLEVISLKWDKLTGSWVFLSFYFPPAYFSATQEQASGSEKRVRYNQCGDILGENTE